MYNGNINGMPNISDQQLTEKRRAARMVAVNCIHQLVLEEEDMVALLGQNDRSEAVVDGILSTYRNFYISASRKPDYVKPTIDDIYSKKLLVSAIENYETACDWVKELITSEKGIDDKYFAIFICAVGEMIIRIRKEDRAVFTAEYTRIASKVFNDNTRCVGFVNAIIDKLFDKVSDWSYENGLNNY